MRWFLLIFISLWALGIPFIIRYEKKEYNHGVCKCGNRLRHFDDDSQGGQGWCCDKCGRVIWISWIKGDGNGA